MVIITPAGSLITTNQPFRPDWLPPSARPASAQSCHGLAAAAAPRSAVRFCLLRLRRRWKNPGCVYVPLNSTCMIHFWVYSLEQSEAAVPNPRVQDQYRSGAHVVWAAYRNQKTFFTLVYFLTETVGFLEKKNAGFLSNDGNVTSKPPVCCLITCKR